MEKFGNFITNPDWWSVFLSAISAIAVIVIAVVQIKIQKQQTKLQEQQNKQQEYDLYRRMYTRVFELDFFNKTMLHRIVAILTSNEDKKLRLKLIEDIWKEYEKQSEEFNECTLDMELKQCGEGIDAKYYYDALQASKEVIQLFKYFVGDELLIFNPSLAYSPQLGIPNTPPKVLIDILLSLFIGSNPQLLRTKLLEYASIVEKTNQAQLLKVIKDRITPNNKK